MSEKNGTAVLIGSLIGAGIAVVVLFVAFPIPMAIAVGAIAVATGVGFALYGTITKLQNFFSFKKENLDNLDGKETSELEGLQDKIQSEQKKEAQKTVGIFLLLAIPTLGFSLLVGIPMVIGRYFNDKKMVANKLQADSLISGETVNVEDRPDKLSSYKALRVKPLKELSQSKAARGQRAKRTVGEKFKNWREGKGERRKTFIEKDKSDSNTVDGLDNEDSSSQDNQY